MNKVVQVLGLLVALLLPKEKYATQEHDHIKWYIQVPQDAFSIYRQGGMFFDGKTDSLLPSDCLDTIKKLSKLKEWDMIGRYYMTTRDWLDVLYSKEPDLEFKAVIKRIQTDFTKENGLFTL